MLVPMTASYFFKLLHSILWTGCTAVEPICFPKTEMHFSIHVVAFEGLMDFFFLSKYETFIYVNGGIQTAVTTQIFSNTQPGD